MGDAWLGSLAKAAVQDAALPDVLTALASCQWRADFSKPRGALFADFGRLKRFGSRSRNCGRLRARRHRRQNLARFPFLRAAKLPLFWRLQGPRRIFAPNFCAVAIWRGASCA